MYRTYVLKYFHEKISVFFPCFVFSFVFVLIVVSVFKMYLFMSVCQFLIEPAEGKISFLKHFKAHVQLLALCVENVC